MTTSKGVLPPPNSHYLIHLDPPDSPGPEYWYGYVPIGKECIISLEDCSLHFHTFTFQTPDGPITDEETLGKIRIKIDRDDERTRTLDYAVLRDGAELPPGTYEAFTSEQSSHRFQPIQVTADSPEQLVFRMPQDTLYKGRIVHALTGEPIPFAMVMAGRYMPPSNIFNPRDQFDAAVVTPQQWQAIHKLPTEPPAIHPVLDPIRRFCNPAHVVRADQDGHFVFVAAAKSRLDEFWAIEENFLPCVYSRGRTASPVSRTSDTTSQGDDSTIELPAFQLVPSAKVSLEPYVEGLRQKMSMSIRLNMRRYPCPDPIRELSSTWLRIGRDVASNRPCAMLVPANTQSLIELIPSGNPQGTAYRPTVTRLTVPALKQGQTLDLGRQPMGPEPERSPILIRVVDSANRPIPHLRVWCDPNHKHFWGFSATSDENGLAEFRVPVPCKGAFVVTTKKEKSDPDIKQTMDFEVRGRQDIGKQFTFHLSDEIYNLLFR
jgi:hypothetical protein